MLFTQRPMHRIQYFVAWLEKPFVAHQSFYKGNETSTMINSISMAMGHADGEEVGL
jgi:hypothetical protein